MPSHLPGLPKFQTTRLASTKKKGRVPGAGKKALLVKDVIHEVVGFAPYQKRMIELIKTGQASAMKRAVKFARKRLGSCRGSKKLMARMERVVDAQKRRD